MRHTLLALFACSFTLLAMPVVASVGPSLDAVASILAANRDAVGSNANAGTMTRHYTYAGQGLTGTTDETFDLVTGRHIDRYDTPPVHGASGFDGSTPWMTDISGASTQQQGGDHPALAINEAYRYANLWWRSDRGGARVESLGRDKEGDHLRVTPPGGKPFDAWFDPVSHQLVHMREAQGFQTIDEHYSHFAKMTGAMAPRTTVIDDGSGAAGRQTLTLVDAVVGPERPASDFAMPRKKPHDWSIGGSVAASGEVALPFRLINNHIFIDVMVNGKGPFPFFVDTGGHSILTPSTAAVLGLKPIGATISGGSGEKTQISGYTKVRSLKMGAATMSDQTVLILDMSPTPVEGFQPGGMVGFEMLQRFVARIDYGTNTLTLIDPKRFDPRDAGTPIPFHFYDQMPQLTGHVAGIPARFDIDTGSRSEVTLTHPYVDANHLRKRFSQSIIATDGWGVGGPSRSQVARIPSIELGGITVPDIIAGLNTQTKGGFSDPNFDGNVGSGFLKRFVVTFDYGHQVMYLKSLAQPGTDTGTFDRSGIWINLGSDGYTVMDVASGSPAATSDLAVGDVITSLDGHGPRELSLADARRLLRTAAAGTHVAVVVRRGKTTRKVDLVLRDLIPPHAPALAD
jgi:hypothetical protein